jgi:hypothetical protein
VLWQGAEAYTHERCGGCNGSGYELTEEGKALRWFVMRHIVEPKLVLGWD